MALSRKYLAAMDIPAEKIDEIITAHTETVNALKEERDSLKDAAANAEALKTENETLKQENDTLKKGNWEKKYSDLKNEYDTFKFDTEKKETIAKKESAYKDLLIKAGVSDKRIASIIKVSGPKIDELILDDDGKIKDADKLLEGVKTEWSDFISTDGAKGAHVETPPEGKGGDDEKFTRGQQLANKYYENLYGKKKED